MHNLLAFALSALGLMTPAGSDDTPAAPTATSGAARTPPAPAPAVPLQTPDAKLTSVIDAIQKAYDGTTSVRGAFTQRYTYTMLRRTQESKGTVAFKKPGLMRWDYAAPQPKAFVIDGKSLWIYQPADKNAFVNACFQQDGLTASVAFMWGQGKLRDQFDISWFDGLFGDKSDHHLVLIPKQASPIFAKLILVVDPKTARVKQSVVVDQTGNVNQFIYNNMQFSAALADAEFRFIPPAGTHVARIPGSCDAPVVGL